MLLLAPSTPLIACDPYFRVWSSAPQLTDVDTTHWTGKPQRLASLISIDGKIYRLMGAALAEIPAISQISRCIAPTQTKYCFSAAGVEVSLTFTTPALPEDLDHINGVLAHRSHGYSMVYEQASILPAARNSLKPTGNVLAVRCRQTSGGQYIDVGLVTVKFRDEN